LLLRGTDIAKSGCEESRMGGLPGELGEGFLEAEEDESVAMTRLAEVLVLPVTSGTRGVVIRGKLSDKRDDAIVAASSVRGGTPGAASSVSNSMGE